MSLSEDERRENEHVHRRGIYDNWGWGWMAAAAIALLLIGGLALYQTGGGTSTSAVAPDATIGQSKPAAPPATNR
jgi:hypothetical protein